MALITCPECRKKISETAAQCPQCGYHLTPEKAAKIKQADGTARGIGCLVILGLVLAVAMCSRGNDSKPSDATNQSPSVSNDSPSASLTPGEHTIASDKLFGCTDRDEFEKIIGFAVEKDSDAFGKELATGMLSGQCVMFSAGETVFLSDTAMFSGLIQVRRKGETLAYWTNLEAISK